MNLAGNIKQQKVGSTGSGAHNCKRLLASKQLLDFVADFRHVLGREATDVGIRGVYPPSSANDNRPSRVLVVAVHSRHHSGEHESRYC